MSSTNGLLTRLYLENSMTFIVLTHINAEVQIILPPSIKAPVRCPQNGRNSHLFQMSAEEREFVLSQSFEKGYHAHHLNYGGSEPCISKVKNLIQGWDMSNGDIE